MPAMAVPLAAAKLDTWEGWVSELTGPRKAAFDDMNARHGLTEHRAYLQPTPDGNYMTLVIAEGPGADSFLPSIMQSDHEFDQWFARSVVDLHDIDVSAPMPPMAARRL
jgi:hypothetical protein